MLTYYFISFLLCLFFDCAKSLQGHTSSRCFDLNKFSSNFRTAKIKRENVENVQNKIYLNAVKAKPEEFPYIVRIYDPQNTSYVNNGGYECAGTLIHANWVLSSQKCIMSMAFRIFLSKRLIVIPQIAENFNNSRTLNIQRPPLIGVELVCPLSVVNNGITYRSNVVLLKLKRPVPVDKGIYPIKISTKKLTTEKLIIPGWGYFDRRERPNSEYFLSLQKTLHYGSFMVTKKCQRYPPYNQFNSICGEGSQVCSGDEGGPIVIKGEHPKKDLLVGVQTIKDSFFPCHRGQKPVRTYAYIVPFRSEIKSILIHYKDRLTN